jgi:hypothetical protein
VPAAGNRIGEDDKCRWLRWARDADEKDAFGWPEPRLSP